MLLFGATLLGTTCLIDAPRLLTLLGLKLDPVRRDPAYWWIGGCVVRGPG